MREFLSRFFNIGLIATNAGWSHSDILFHERFKSAPIKVDLQQDNFLLFTRLIVERKKNIHIFTYNYQEIHHRDLTLALSWKRCNPSTLGRWGGNWPESPLDLGKRTRRVIRLDTPLRGQPPPFSNDLERRPDSKLSWPTRSSSFVSTWL